MAAPSQYVEASHSLIYCNVDGHGLERNDERKDLQHLIFVLASLGGAFVLIILTYLPPLLYHAAYLMAAFDSRWLLSVRVGIRIDESEWE